MTDSTNTPQPIIPGLANIYEPLKPYAYPIVRFVAGAWMIPHGYPKLTTGTQATAGFFAKIGLEPAVPLVLLVGTVEAIGGLLIAIGLLTRPVAAMAAIVMAVAAFKVHLPNGFGWTSGGFEYPLMWCALMLVICIKGGGAMSVDRRIGKEF